MILGLLGLLVALCLGLDFTARTAVSSAAGSLNALGLTLQSVRPFKKSPVSIATSITISLIDYTFRRGVALFGLPTIISVTSAVFAYLFLVALLPVGAIANVFRYDGDGLLVLAIWTLIVNVAINRASYRKTAVFLRGLSVLGRNRPASFMQALSVIFADVVSSVFFAVIVFSASFAMVQLVFESTFAQRSHDLYFIPESRSEGNVPIFYISLKKEFFPKAPMVSSYIKEDEKGLPNWGTSWSSEWKDDFSATSAPFSPQSGFVGILINWSEVDKEPSKALIDSSLAELSDTICYARFRGKHDGTVFQYEVSICSSRSIGLSDRFFRNVAKHLAQLSWFFYYKGMFYMSINPFLFNRFSTAAILTVPPPESSDATKIVDQSLAIARTLKPFQGDHITDDSATYLREGIARSKYQMDELPTSTFLATSILTPTIFLALLVAITAIDSILRAYSSAIHFSNRYFLPVTDWPLTFLLLMFILAGALLYSFSIVLYALGRIVF